MISEPVSTHPMKVTVAGTPSDQTLESADGWMDMDVKWLVTSESVGAESSVFGITVFPPGSKHDIHRHPHAEEIEYLVSGSGVAQVGDADVLLEAGELVFVPKNDYHGFHTTSETETAVMVWTYAPAASLSEAGYIRKVDDERD
jgi:quercetin dioxygenase-like cupin family protein